MEQHVALALVGVIIGCRAPGRKHSLHCCRCTSAHGPAPAMTASPLRSTSSARRAAASRRQPPSVCFWQAGASPRPRQPDRRCITITWRMGDAGFWPADGPAGPMACTPHVPTALLQLCCLVCSGGEAQPGLWLIGVEWGRPAEVPAVISHDQRHTACPIANALCTAEAGLIIL